MTKLAQKVKRTYGLRFKRLNKIDHKTTNYLGKFKTSRRKRYVVKGMPVKQKRQRFIVKTEELLAKKGVKLARPVPTKNNRLFFTYKGLPYVVYEWVEGKKHPMDTRKDLLSAVKTIAVFHQASHGLVYPQKMKMYSHSSWLKDYKQRLSSMKNWEKKHKRSKSRTHRYILKHIPYFYKVGVAALKKLQQSTYRRLTSQPYPKQSLVHGDFHQGNIIIRGKQRVLIDFEDVRYDLPSKDLLRIFSMFNRNRKFNGKDFKAMMEVYERIHPLTADLRKIVLIDFLFPHIFERDLRKKKYFEVNYLKAVHLIQQEKKKLQFIRKNYF